MTEAPPAPQRHADAAPGVADCANPLLAVDNLRTWFPIRRGVFARTVGHVRAVDGVSLAVYTGETLALVGESGCGKTTLGRSVLNLEPTARGGVRFQGRQILGMRESQFRPHRRDLQMVFQDPYSSLNPRLTVLSIVTEAMRYHRLLGGESRSEAATRLLAEVGLDADSIHRYPHEFSGGQRQRISIARALSLQPAFVVCDEPVSALDVSVQAQVINLLMDLRERHGLSYLFISHDLSVVRLIADRVAVMYVGEIVETGPTQEVLGEPRHPYTQALISAIPAPGRERKERIVLQGDLPSPARPPPGCRFHPRCPHAMALCKAEPPAETTHGKTIVRCHLYPADDPETEA